MRSNVLKALVAIVVGVLLVPLAGISSPAYALVSAPLLLTPDDGVERSSNPELTWAYLPGARKYDVQVASSPDFATASVEFSQSTLNTTATPPNDLTVKVHYWRVRAYDSASVAGPFSAARSFEKVNADAPSGLQPPEGGREGGLPLRYADDPLVLSWHAMPGVKTYEVQIDDDPLFVGAPTPTSTYNTSFTPPNPPLRTTVYWHVRGKSSQGVPTQWSAPLSYSMVWDAVPILSTPENVESPTIEEVVLKWEQWRNDKQFVGMPGASAYELQISPDVEFNNPIGGTRVVNGTSFAPSTTLPNGAYFWRVRGLTTASTPEPSNWSATWVFTRAWPATNKDSRPRGTETETAQEPLFPYSQVKQNQPANGNYTSFREPIFSWSPQREASHYEFQVGSDYNFSPDTYASCLTNHTTFTSYRVTPTSAPLCPAGSGQVNYWRVRAVDGPASAPPVYGVWSEVRSFLYDPATVGVVQLSPIDGATVPVPVLTWEPVADIARYKVTIDPSDPLCATVTAITYNTTYVPADLRATCTGTFGWTVQAFAANGGLSRLPLGDWPQFSLAPDTAVGTLEPVALASNVADPYRPPLMTWQPRQGALAYTVWVSVHGASSYVKMHGTTTQPGFAYTGEDTPLSHLLPPGEYDFFVRAYSNTSGTVLLETSSVHSFSISSLPTTVLTSPINCPVESQSCPVRHDTPTLDWEPVRGAGEYLVYLSTDPNFTNITRTWRTQHSTLTPVESLPDSQAGQATYWFVRPCYEVATCGPFDTNVLDNAYAFRKRSFAVSPTSPLAGDRVPDEVTFEWQDYLKTNQEQDDAFVDPSSPDKSEVVTQEARNYKVQVSTTAEFTNIVDTSPLVDQTRYEAQARTYPDGPLFWRVQAYDNSNNPLTFSDPIAFTKKSPGPDLLTPVNDRSDPCAPTGPPAELCVPAVHSAPVLTWKAKTFAATYQVEVYKNPDSPLSSTNRVLSISTRATVAIPTTSLPPAAYIWRVRRLDVNGLPGAWTADTNSDMWRFTVDTAAAELVSPTDGQIIPNNDVVLRWTSVPGATRYLVEASTSDTFTTKIESVSTDLTSWAPGLVSPAWPDQRIYWRVTTLDAAGQRLATFGGRSFVKDASTRGEFTAISPCRLLDTRVTKQPIGANKTRMFDVTGGLNTGVPASGVSAVVMNVTVTSPTTRGYLTVYPYGSARPTASNLNFVAGQTVPNLVTVGVDSSGRVNLYNAAGTSHVILDIVGYYSGGTLLRATRFVSADRPTRILDTRGGAGQVARPLTAGEVRTIPVAGQGLGGVPAGATSVVMNVTAVGPTQVGYLTLFPAGQATPTASNLNFVPRVTVPNLVSVRLGAGGEAEGKVSILNATGLTHVLFDVVGWYVAGNPAAGATFNPLPPGRILDTRLVSGGPKLAALSTRAVQIRGIRGVPTSTDVTAVVLNVTVTQPDGPGYATVYPSGTTPPRASNLNYSKGQTVPNLVVARVGDDGRINLLSTASTHVIVDVVGWFGD